MALCSRGPTAWADGLLPDVSCRLETALITDLVKCGQCTRWQPFLTVEVGCSVNGSLRSLNLVGGSWILETPDAGRMEGVESLSRRHTREVVSTSLWTVTR